MCTPVELEELGRRIRKTRVERRLTLKQLEEACGLSATHLSEIERGKTSPTIGALIRIARALQRDPSYFLEPDERPDVVHVRRDESPDLLTPMEGVTAEVLAPGIPGSEISAYRIRLDPESGALRLDSGDIPAEAVYFVTEGTLKARVGDEQLCLDAGDSLQASLARPHVISAEAGRAAEVLAVLTRSLQQVSGPPRRSGEARGERR